MPVQREGTRALLLKERPPEAPGGSSAAVEWDSDQVSPSARALTAFCVCVGACCLADGVTGFRGALAEHLAPSWGLKCPDLVHQRVWLRFLSLGQGFYSLPLYRRAVLLN